MQERQQRRVESIAAKQARSAQEGYVFEEGEVHPKCNPIYPSFDDEPEGEEYQPGEGKFIPPVMRTPPEMSESDHAREICTHLYYWNKLSVGRASDYRHRLDLLEEINPAAYDYYVELMATNFEPLHQTFEERAKARLTSRQNEHQTLARIIASIIEVFPAMADLFRSRFRHVPELHHVFNPPDSKESL